MTANHRQEPDTDVLYAEQSGLDHIPEGMGEHYTLGGVRVAEPRGNFGRDYWNLYDAEGYGCIPLKPSVFGMSGMSPEEVKAQYF